MLRNYFSIAFRKLIRHKIYTIINILGLALGISACLIIFLITRFELSYDRFHPEKERIYRVVANLRRHAGDDYRKLGFILVPLAPTIRQELSGFEKVSAFYNYNAKVSVPDGNRPAKLFDPATRGQASDIVIAEPQYFDIFKYQWLAGDAAHALNDPFKVVLSSSQANRYFGEKDPDKLIGRQITYNDSLVVTVSGIVKDWDQNSDLVFKDFISAATIPASFLKNEFDMTAWGMWDYDAQGFVKLAKGVTPEQVERQFPAFIKKHVMQPESEGASSILKLQPLSDLHFNAEYEDAYSRKANLPTLYGLMGIALFILVIAAINFINLSTAQSIQRAKEIGIRKVLGSSRGKIIIQFLSETFILTLIAVLLSVLIANPIIAMLGNLVPKGVRLNPYEPSTLIFLVAVTLVTSLLAGLYPARVLSGYLPAWSLKGQGAKLPSQKTYLHKGLIVFQFSISLLFMIGTIIVSNQIHYVLSKDLGFTRDAVITLRTGYSYPSDKRKLLVDKFSELPSVKIISTHMETPEAKGHPGTFILYKGASERKVDASFDMCDENYVPLFELRMLAGRNILHADTIREFLVNETCSKELGFQNPQEALGKTVEIGMNGGKGPIVGVVADFHSKSLHEPITPFFISSFKRAERAVSLHSSTRGKEAAHFTALLTQMRKIWKEIYPKEKFEYSFLDDSIAKLYEKEQKTSQLMNIAMTIAIFISCMGLFGLATFTAEQRTKEIGIRKVLGASVLNIVRMLTRDFVLLVIVAMAIASPVAWYFMNKWLQDFVYRVNINWWVFALAGFAAMLIAIITVSFQAIRAAIANPVESLRAE